MAHTYHATVAWRRKASEPFTDNRYSRGHVWRFDEGVEVPASSSPLVVPRNSVAAAVDPEEAFVASLSSCHMLFFLNFAAIAGFRIDAYEDAAVGEMGKNEAGKAIVAIRRRDEVGAKAAFDELRRAEGDNGLYQQAQVLAQWGKVDEAFAALDRASAEADSGLVYLLSDPFLEPLHELPRFKALLRRLHFV